MPQIKFKQWAWRGLRRSNRVHFTRYPSEYHPGITGVSPEYHLSITQILPKSGHSKLPTHVLSLHLPPLALWPGLLVRAGLPLTAFTAMTYAFFCCILLLLPPGVCSATSSGVDIPRTLCVSAISDPSTPFMPNHRTLHHSSKFNYRYRWIEVNMLASCDTFPSWRAL
jgi:hypothetical protein